LSPQQFETRKAPQGSVHDGLRHVNERDIGEMLIETTVCGSFSRTTLSPGGIPITHPVHPPTPPDQLRKGR
jgi:hypothetical protein